MSRTFRAGVSQPLVSLHEQTPLNKTVETSQKRFRLSRNILLEHREISGLFHPRQGTLLHHHHIAFQRHQRHTDNDLGLAEKGQDGTLGFAGRNLTLVILLEELHLFLGNRPHAPLHLFSRVAQSP